MTKPAHYQTMARYNAWMNDKLYAAAAQLSDDERKRDRSAFFRSIHGTLNHLLLADAIWLMRFTRDKTVLPRDPGGETIRITGLAQILHEDFEHSCSERHRTDARILAWASELEDADLESELSYATSTGAAQSHPLWWAASHFFNHQTHHRGQVTTMLTQAGADVGATDLVVMLRDEANARAAQS